MSEIVYASEDSCLAGCGRSATGRSKWCSATCYAWSRRHPGEARVRSCEACGHVFGGRRSSPYCSRLCEDVGRERRFIGPQGAVIVCAICESRRAVPIRTAKVCHVCRPEWERRRGERWRAANPERRQEQERHRKRPNRSEYVRRWRRERWMDEHAAAAAPAWSIAVAEVDRGWLALPPGPPVKERIGPTCAVACLPRRKFVDGFCLECGESFIACQDRGDRFCSILCGKRYGRRLHRERKRAAFVEPVYRRKVFERDGWRCQIPGCKKLVSKTAVVPHPRAATIDHIVPTSKGGEHSMANVHTAHFMCNSQKGAQARDEQLRLVG